MGQSNGCVYRKWTASDHCSCELAWEGHACTTTRKLLLEPPLLPLLRALVLAMALALHFAIATIVAPIVATHINIRTSSDITNTNKFDSTFGTTVRCMVSRAVRRRFLLSRLWNLTARTDTAGFSSSFRLPRCVSLFKAVFSDPRKFSVGVATDRHESKRSLDNSKCPVSQGDITTKSDAHLAQLWNWPNQMVGSAR